MTSGISYLRSPSVRRVDSVQLRPRTHFRGIPATSGVSVVKRIRPRCSGPLWAPPACLQGVAAVIGDLIDPVVPAVDPARYRDQSALRDSGTIPPRRGLPLPDLPARRTAAFVYGMAAVDCRGRIADQTVLRALGWSPGTRVDIRQARGVLMTRAEAGGEIGVSSQGHLRLPAAVRHWCGLTPGDRVLLAADPTRGRLVVHSPAALDVLIAQGPAGSPDGDHP